MPDDVATANRGRIQAQGNGLETSRAWCQPTPPTRSEGHGFIDELIAQLSQREFQERERGFIQARRFVDQAAIGGGVASPAKKSFPQPPLPRGRRVDIEVHKGTAFVPDPDPTQ